MTPQVYLRKGKEESLMRRHPWIFSGAIDHIKAEDESEITEGALVEIYTRTGDFIALGHYQIGSIAVRVLTFDKEPIDQAWWNRRIAVCADALTTKACGTRSQSLENAEHRGMGPPKRRCVSVTGSPALPCGQRRLF